MKHIPRIKQVGFCLAVVFAVAMLALHDASLAAKLQAFRAEQTQAARDSKLPPV